VALMLSCCATSPRNLAARAGAADSGAAAPVAGVSATASAATTPTAGELNRRIAAQLSPAMNETDLPLGVGDLVEVSVFDVPELSQLKVRIPPSGSITLPLLGNIRAAGLSALEMETTIRKRLEEKYMHDPQVAIFVHEHKSQRISVIGAVRTGGVFTVSSGLRLADALALTGGLTEDAGHVVYVIRRVQAGEGPPEAHQADSPAPEDRPSDTGIVRTRDEVMTAIDLQGLADGRPELNLMLHAGDVVEIPRAGSYYVGGEVHRPGSYVLKARTTLDQATVAAGGIKSVADFGDVRVYRTTADGQRQVLTYSFKDFEKGVSPPEVRPNDVILVGKSGLKAFLYGVLDFVRFGFGASVPIP
jgi:polysaccharide biosynthesis/export protein